MTLAKRIVPIVIAFLCIVTNLYAQVTSSPHRGVVQLPIGHEAYTFLRHLSVRGLIEDYSEVQLPISEYEAAQFLRSVDTTSLSSTERELRLKYLQQTAREPYPATTVFGGDSTKSFFSPALFSDDEKYLYRWRSDATNSDLYVNGIASLELRRREEFEPASVMLGVLGGRMFGTLSGHVGYFLEATNGQSFGDSSVALEDPQIGRNKNFTAYSRNNFDFTSAELAYNYDWFTGKIAREAVALGGSYQGDNVTLSPNVPYYDLLSLQAHVGAVRYQAILASLLGDPRFSVGFDTNTKFVTGPSINIDDKYLVAHNLTFFIGSDVEMGFSDMIIFSKRFDLAYLNPFSFLKSVEHSLGDRDNGLLGAHVRTRILPGVELRGQVFMDDVAASRIGEGYWSNKFAWQLGAMWAAPLGLNELDLMLEWTRVEPYMYSHFNSQNTFSTSRTILGSQIGPNAISWWGRAHWSITRDLSADVDLQLIQRGENKYDSAGNLIFNAGSDFEQSISADVGERRTYILDGQRVNILSVSAYVQYEPWRGIQFFARGTKKQAEYLNGIPFDPKEHSESMLSFGARALF
jgi:hypothetical protein